MKVAVLLAGNVRTLELCKQNILDTFKFLSPDYFVSTYNNSHQYHYFMKRSLNFHNDIALNDEEIKNKFVDFSIKDILIDDQQYAEEIYTTESEKFNKNMLFGDSSHFLQFWKIKRGLDLITQYEIDNNISYDIIIKTRTDLIHKDLSCINFSNIHEKIVVCNSTERNTESMQVNDQIIISTKKNIVNVIDFMINEFYAHSSERSSVHIPHSLLKYSIDSNNLTADILPLLECIQRENGIRSYL